MSTIKSLFEILNKNKFGLKFSDEFVIGFVEYLLYPGIDKDVDPRNCFANAKSILEEKDTDSSKERSLKQHLQKTGISFPLNWTADTSNSWNDAILVNEVLKYEFNVNERELFKTLILLTQAQFFTNRFRTFSGKVNDYSQDMNQQYSDKVGRLLKALSFRTKIGPQTLSGEVNRIFLHAATQPALEPRFEMLAKIYHEGKFSDDQVIVDYVTNPRGLSKNESATAHILASWFTNDSDLQKEIFTVIQDVFKDQKNKECDWYNNLDTLKASILLAINEKLSGKVKFELFPNDPNGDNEEIYYRTAKLDKNRNPLGGKWPTTTHLMQYLAKKYQILDRVNFNVVLVAGKVTNDARYIPARTQDLFREFCNYKEAKHYLNQNHCCAISDGSVSLGGPRQAYMLNAMMKEHLSKDSPQITTLYDAQMGPIDLGRAFKELTAFFYEISLREKWYFCTENKTKLSTKGRVADTERKLLSSKSEHLSKVSSDIHSKSPGIFAQHKKTEKTDTKEEIKHIFG